MTGESRGDLDREARLVGAAVGGGLPLPLAFDAVATELTAREAVAFDDLVTVIEKSMGLQRKRVLSLAWRTWDDFAADILDQMESQHLIWSEPAIGMDQRVYAVTPDFMSNRHYVVIPKADIGFTMWDQESRTQRGADSALAAELRALMSQYGGRVHPQAMELLQETAHVLAGHHAPAAPEKKRRRSTVRPDERPTSAELAEKKYGLNGHTPAERVKRVFGEDGCLECRKCHLRRPPDEYRVTWDSRVSDWFFPGWCIPCDNQRNRSRPR